MTLLVWRLGGHQLLHALQQRYGLCSVRTMKLLDRLTFLISPQGFRPEHATSNTTSTLPTGFAPRVMMLDELAIEGAAGYDSTTDQLAGLCWQHSQVLDLAVTSQAKISELHGAVHGEGSTTHIATEATVLAVGMLGETEYSARAVMAAPHCKHGSSADQLKLLLAALNWWWGPGGPHMQYGPILCLSSDGASIRRGPLHQLFETRPLAATSSLYGLVSTLPLLDLHVCTLGDMTVNFDEKHLGKRLRGAIISATRGIQIGPCMLVK